MGYADLIYLPKKGSSLPALVIELKWNQTAKGAIAQIRNRQYPKLIEGYGGELLLVGIAYDKDAPAGQRKHSCIIETMQNSFAYCQQHEAEIREHIQRSEG